MRPGLNRSLDFDAAGRRSPRRSVRFPAGRFLMVKKGPLIPHLPCPEVSRRSRKAAPPQLPTEQYCIPVGAREFATSTSVGGAHGRTPDLLPSSRLSGETLSRRNLRSTPCRYGALIRADQRWFLRVSGWVALVGSSQQRWALSLTLTLFRVQFTCGSKFSMSQASLDDDRLSKHTNDSCSPS